MGAPDIERFLTHLAVNRHVAASTQNQALNALVFLYKQVMEIERALIWRTDLGSGSVSKRRRFGRK